MIDEAEKTPTEPPKSEFELLAEAFEDFRQMLTRVDDRSMQILDAQAQQREINKQLDRRITMVELQRVVGPYLLATLALLFAGLSMMR